MIRRGEWTETRRRVWNEARKQIRDHAADVWNFRHPDDRRLQLSPEPPENYYAPANLSFSFCSIWLRPVTIYDHHGTIPVTKAHKVHDGKNDDTFYVSIEGDVWVEG